MNTANVELTYSELVMLKQSTEERMNTVANGSGMTPIEKARDIIDLNGMVNVLANAITGMKIAFPEDFED